MDALFNSLTGWASSLLAAHPKAAVWLMLFVAFDNYVLKIIGPTVKAKFGITLPDNLADSIGNFVAKIISGANLPKQ